MNALSPAIALVIGFTSTLHCWAMCGGIVGALSMGVPEQALRSAGRRALLAAGYNLGRIASYTLAGIMFGAAGGTLIAIVPSDLIVVLSRTERPERQGGNAVAWRLVESLSVPR